VKLHSGEDEQIDLLSEGKHNIQDTNYQGLNVMKPPSARSNNETVQQRAEAREAKKRQENARKARQKADREFPGEKWKFVEDGIYLSPRRPIGDKTSYKDELKDAQILRDLGSTVYLSPEVRSDKSKKYDAIVNGLIFEFKDVGGNANTLEHQFLRSRSQAPNVFINLEKSSLTRREIMSTLYGARNKPESAHSHGYAYYNKFHGGRIILKMPGRSILLNLNVDDLKVSRK
jgi:hypothetical protein